MDKSQTYRICLSLLIIAITDMQYTIVEEIIAKFMWKIV